MSDINVSQIPLQYVNNELNELKIDLYDYISTDDQAILQKLAFQLSSDSYGQILDHYYIQNYDVSQIGIKTVQINVLYSNIVKILKFNIKIEKKLLTNISQMNPVQSSLDVPVTTTLSWYYENKDDEELLYDIYFGEQNQINLIQQNVTENSFYVTDLKQNTYYYWKIVINDKYKNKMISPTWVFKTGENNINNQQWILKNMTSNIIFDNGYLYVISGNKYLKKYDVNGTEIWSVDIS